MNEFEYLAARTTHCIDFFKRLFKDTQYRWGFVYEGGKNGERYMSHALTFSWQHEDYSWTSKTYLVRRRVVSQAEVEYYFIDDDTKEEVGCLDDGSLFKKITGKVRIENLRNLRAFQVQRGW